MRLHDEATAEAVRRLRRAEGQIAGVVRMLEEGRDCRDIITQLAAASKAIDRAGFGLMASGMKQCLTEPGGDITEAEMVKLFQSLA